jgi:hypothetical protein
VAEIRPLRLPDLPFAIRMAKHGVGFDTQVSLTSSHDGLRYAYLSQAGRMPVFVLRRDSEDGLGQLHFASSTQQARLAFVTPSIQDGASEQFWLTMLDELTIMAGKRGAINIIAEVAESAVEFEMFRQAGFAAYTRQDLWVRRPMPVSSPGHSLKVTVASDISSVLGLYNTLSPGLIKQIEPAPTLATRCHILANDRGICGLATIYKTGQAVLVEPYLNANKAIEPREFLAATLKSVRAERRTIYCRLRDYMGITDGAMRDHGFEHYISQVAMFRHTTVKTVHQTYKLVEQAEGRVPLPTSITGNHEDNPSPLTS